MIGVFRGCRIAANAVAVIAIVPLLVNPTHDMTPTCLKPAAAPTLWFGPEARGQDNANKFLRLTTPASRVAEGQLA
jgi:hypothetical protein